MDNKVEDQSIKSIIKNWAMQSTSHGIPKIASSPYTIIKITWTIFFLASFGFCSYCLLNSFQEYFSFGVNTQMSITTKSSLQFPAITFCNKNPFKTNDKSFQFRDLFISVYNEMVNLSKHQGLNGLEKITLGLDQVAKSIIYSSIENEQNRAFLGYTIDEMLISCSFNLLECDKNDFDFYWSNAYGNCYQFNNGKRKPLKTLTTSGRQVGLKLDLYAGFPNNELSFLKSNGIIIFIHNSSNIPIMTMEGINLSTGFETEISLSQVNFKRLASPFDNCVENFDSYLYKKTIELNSIYRQKFCMQLCYQEALIKNCECYELNSFKIPGSKPCSIDNIDCAYRVITDFFNGTNSQSSDCLKDCPQECNIYSYNMKYFQSYFPTPYYADLIMNYVNNTLRKLSSIEEIRQTSLSVNIYFDDLVTTLIEEQPNKTPTQLVSDIGGNLGLFIGISLLSIVEILELFLELMIYFLSFKKKSKIGNNEN